MSTYNKYAFLLYGGIILSACFAASGNTICALFGGGLIGLSCHYNKRMIVEMIESSHE